MGILRGLQGVTELQAQRRWSRDGGWQTIRTFRARTKPDLEALVSSVQATALDFTITEQNGPVGTLVATFGDQQSGEADESTQTSFELLSEDEEVSIFNSNLFQTLNSSAKLQLKGAVAQYEKGQEDDEFSGVDAETLSLLFETYKVDDSFQQERWVLRKTQTIGSFYRVRLNVIGSSPSALDVSLQGVGTIFTTSQLIAFETELPSSIIAALNYYPAPTEPPYMQWGWLKKIPTLTQKAGNKLDASVDYVLRMWPVAYYEPYA